MVVLGGGCLGYLGICGGKRRIASVPLSQPIGMGHGTYQKPQNIQSILLHNSRAWVLENGFFIEIGGWNLICKVNQYYSLPE